MRRARGIFLSYWWTRLSETSSSYSTLESAIAFILSALLGRLSPKFPGNLDSIPKTIKDGTKHSAPTVSFNSFTANHNLRSFGMLGCATLMRLKIRLKGAGDASHWKRLLWDSVPVVWRAIETNRMRSSIPVTWIQMIDMSESVPEIRHTSDILFLEMNAKSRRLKLRV